MSKKEALIEKIMKEFEADGEPVTREDAEVMAEMELKANTGAIAKADSKPRKPRRSPEKDPEKVAIIKEIYEFLLTSGKEDATIVNEQREITFGSYSIQLIKHRPKKEDK